MRTPAEHAALARVRLHVLALIAATGADKWRVEDVIGALRVLLADPGVRADVLVALGLPGELGGVG